METRSSILLPSFPGVARVLGVEVLGDALDGLHADVGGQVGVDPADGVGVVHWNRGGREEKGLEIGHLLNYLLRAS